MKRNILSLLLFVLTTIFIVSCSDSSDDSGGSSAPANPDTPSEVTPIDLSNPDTLVGTYDITFFYTDAMLTKLTTNCSEAVSKGFTTQDSCSDADNVSHQGEAVITKTNTGIKIATKIQMSGGTFENPSYSSLVTGQNYQYTEYPEIPFSAITTDVNTGDTAVKGTTGRNLTKETESPNDTYTFKVQADGTLLNEMKNNMVLPVDVRVIMKKESDIPATLDPNKPYDPAPANFKEIPDPA